MNEVFQIQIQFHNFISKSNPNPINSHFQKSISCLNPKFYKSCSAKDKTVRLKAKEINQFFIIYFFIIYFTLTCRREKKFCQAVTARPVHSLKLLQLLSDLKPILQ